jgi:serine/threonine protein kinase
VLSECDHDNLCGFEGVYETENTIYLVMPSYDRTLTSILHSSAPLPRALVTLLMRQLLQGVAHLHAKGLMHRDLKLDNIMLNKTAEGTRVVIIDMGMAEQIAAEAYLFDKCGTPGYVAPEIFGPRAPHPEKCDIFSLGVIFHVL